MADFELIENLPFKTSQTVGAKARIGLVVLASDYTIEDEFRALLAQLNDPGIALFHARIANTPNITPQTLAAMGPAITETAQRLLPDDHLDVLAYGCTSASMVLGPDAVAAMLKQAKPESAVSNPALAAFAALNAFGARRVAVLTPYRDDVNIAIRKSMMAQGFEVPVLGSFNEEMDPVVATIDADSMKAAVARLVEGRQLDAVFVSCTSLRLMHIINDLEAETGLPVTSSNHAMAWHCLRLAGLKDEISGYGSLFRLGLSR